MSVLAIDTSRRGVAVCVLANPDGTVIKTGKTDQESLSTALPQLLHNTIDDQLESIVVVTGPGSYTGVRAGMAAALGLAMVRGLPIYGVTSLLTIAAGAPSSAERITAVFVAGRGGGDVADFDHKDGQLVLVSEPRHVTLSDWTAPAGRHLVANADMGGADAVDPEAALAAAIPLALTTEPLPQIGLSATQINPVEFAVGKPRVSSSG